MVMTGKTSTGFTYAVDDRCKTDWGFVGACNVLQSAETTEFQKFNAMNTMLSVMFKDSGVALLEHVAKNNDGFRDIKKVMDEVNEIMESDSDLKK